MKTEEVAYKDNLKLIEELLTTEEQDWYISTKRFAPVDSRALQKLVDMKAINPKARFGNAPNLSEFISIANELGAEPGTRARLSGLLIHPDDVDAGLVVDQLRLYVKKSSATVALESKFLTVANTADVFDRQQIGDEIEYYAWWS